MNSKKIKQYEFLVDNIYNIEAGEERWGPVLDFLNNCVSADSAVLFRLGQDEAPPIVYGSSLDHDEDAEKAYVEHYYAGDELAWHANNCDLNPLQQYTIHNFLGKKGISNSEWYNDFFLKRGYQYLGAVFLDKKTPKSGRLSFAYMRSKAAHDFKPSDADMAIKVARHIERSIFLDNELNKQRQTLSTFLNMFDHLSFGVLLVDTAGHVLELNAEAQEIISRSDGLRLHRRRLIAIDKHTDRRLTSLIKQRTERSGKGRFPSITTLRIPRKGRTAYYTTAIVPDQKHSIILKQTSAVVSILIFDSLKSTTDLYEWMKDLYNLSRSESSLVSSLISGITLNEHAEKKNITKNTARSMLKTVFLKTNTSSQNQLIQEVLKSPIGALRRKH